MMCYHLHRHHHCHHNHQHYPACIALIIIIINHNIATVIIIIIATVFNIRITVVYLTATFKVKTLPYLNVFLARNKRSQVCMYALKKKLLSKGIPLNMFDESVPTQFIIGWLLY